jgi:hypothetical protein
MSEYVTQADREATVRLFGITEWIAEEYRSGKRDNTYEVLAFADHRHASLAAAKAENAAAMEKLRSDVFEILRQHNASDQCFAEVAAVTHAALVGKE